MLLFTFGSPHKKEKKNCQKKTKKIYNNEKRTHGHLENTQRLVEEVQKIQRLKINSIFLADEGLIEEENSKIRCLRTQLDFIERLIEFMKGLIARKFDF